MERLRTLSEAECYARCYGWRYTEDTVKVLPRRVERDATEVAAPVQVPIELQLDTHDAEAA
jgi:hypothetical protein